MTKKAKGAEKDRFIQIAAGGKKMTGESGSKNCHPFPVGTTKA